MMRLTLFAIILAAAQSYALNGYTQATRLNFSMESTTVRQVLLKIEQISEFRFLYNSKIVDVDRKVNVDFRDLTIDKAMDTLFKGTDVAYRIIDRQVVLYSKNDPVFESGLVLPQHTVSGKVTDNNNRPIPGVTVVVKGSTQGTITNAAGDYQMTNIPEDAILVFSFVGMRTREIVVGTQTSINLSMEVDIIGLEEVVAIGYGTAKKSDLTGSVVRVGKADIRKMASSHLIETLSGTVPGLLSNQSTNAAGGGSLEIRGPSSLSAGTDPLIVLDGVIFFGSMRDINPNDIESIDILKDASSTAIFGAKAASGVIIITTKKGEGIKSTINFSAKVGVSATTNDLKPYGMDNPREYLDAHRDYQRQRNPDQPHYYYFHPDDLPGNISLEEWLNYSANPAGDPLDEWASRSLLWPVEYENYKSGRTTDFYDFIIGPALRQDYHLSVGGAKDDIKYYWSIGYLDNKGIIKGDQYKAIRTRLNISNDITEWLNVGTNTHFSTRDESVIEASLTRLSQMSPYGSMWNDDGTLRKYPLDYNIIRNPLEDYYGADKLRTVTSLFSSLFAEIKLPFGFRYKISWQPRFQFVKDYQFFSTDTHTGSVTYVGGRGTRTESEIYEWMLDNLIKWNRQFGEHHFDLTLLANAEQRKTWQSDQENVNFYPNDRLSYHGLQFGSSPGLNNNDSESSGDALMARLNYTLMDRYLFTGSVRRDGYSAFGQKNPRATFPALAFAWKISEEGFYPAFWMNRLKLRLSWGINGNRDIGQYAALARLGSIANYSLSGYEIGVFSSTLANAELLWEETEAFNIGLDIGLLDNRIDMSIDAYDGTTYNLLLDRQLPRITGFNSITSNLGKLGNKGIEATINSINLSTNDLTWRSSLLFSMNRNKIKELWGDYGSYILLGEERYGELPDFQNEWFPGYASDVIWDYDIIGIWQLEEEETASLYGMKPGDFKAFDVNEDDKYTQLEDKKFIGHTAPRYRLGLKNDILFLKHFTASLFVRADLGHLRHMPILTPELSTFGLRNAWGIPYWSPENPTNDFPRLVWPSTLSQYGGGIKAYKPTGFVRVQDVSLSYDLPANAANKMLMQNMRISAIVRNLFTFTNYSGFDPESGMTPMPRTFTLGVDITL